MNSPSFNSPVSQLLGGDDFGDYLLKNANQNASGNRETWEENARKRGWSVEKGGAFATRGLPFSSGQEKTPIEYFKPARDPSKDFPPLLLRALMTDTRAMQGAADEQWNRNNQQIGALDRWLGGVGGRVQSQAQGLAGNLRQTAGQAEGLGAQQLEEYGGFGKGVMDRVHGAVDQYGQNLDEIKGGMKGMYTNLDDARGDIEEGYQLADQAASQFEGAINEYEDRTAQDASVVAAGIRRNASTAMRMARSGVHPDGTPMTAGEQAAAISQIQQDVDTQVQSAVTPIFSEYNRNKTQLQTALAQLRQGNAQLRMTGAGTKGQLADVELRGRGMEADIEKARLAGTELEAQTGLAVGDQFLKAQAGQREMMTLSAGLQQTAAQLEQTSLLESVKLELAGRTQLAQLVQQNPRSVVSWFQSLLSLYSVRAGATGNTQMG